MHSFNAEMYSCTDVYKNGARHNGIYSILKGNDSFKVYCDFESEANSTWTLITSFALKNIKQLNVSLFRDNPVRGHNPNWESYRY